MAKPPIHKPLEGFATQEEQTSFLGWMRLLNDDVAELSGALGILISLSRRSATDDIYKCLNKNPAFWNAMLLALQTNVFTVVGRIYDTGKHAHLKRILKFAKSHKALKEPLDQFELVAAKNAKLIGDINELRNNVADKRITGACWCR